MLGVEVMSCVNSASPVVFVLSLFYLCAFQMNPVCVLCLITSDLGLFIGLWHVVTSPKDWSECWCVFVCVVGPGFD